MGCISDPGGRMRSIGPHVGIMTGHFPRPSSGETLDAIIGHGIRHVQLNLSSARLTGPLAEQTDSVFHGIRAEFEKRDMTIAGLGGEFNMVDPDPEKRVVAAQERHRGHVPSSGGLGAWACASGATNCGRGRPRTVKCGWRAVSRTSLKCKDRSCSRTPAPQPAMPSFCGTSPDRYPGAWRTRPFRRAAACGCRHGDIHAVRRG